MYDQMQFFVLHRGHLPMEKAMSQLTLLISHRCHRERMDWMDWHVKER